MSKTRKRAEVLSDLVHLNGDLVALRKEVSQFPWDMDIAVFTVTKEHLEKILSMYSGGNIDAEQLEQWADAIEVREDIDFSEDQIKEIVHELANPLLFGDNLEERIAMHKASLRREL